MVVIGLDPGPERSALASWDGTHLHHSTFGPNGFIERYLDELPSQKDERIVLVIERVESFGMAVGAEVFETVFHSGRFSRAFEPRRWDRLPRRAIKQHLCHTARATDSNIRQAILDRFGGTELAIGRKATPGVLYNLKGHLWAAFAVALTWYDLNAARPEDVRPGVQAEF